MERTRVLIVSGDAPNRDATHSKLRQHVGDFELVGDAWNGDEAIREVNSHSPDVVLLDVHVDGADPLFTTRRLRQLSPTLSVIHLSRKPTNDEMFGAIRYGAAAYLPKDVSADELADVIRRVHLGSYVIDDSVLANPELASRVLAAFRELTAHDQRVEVLFAPLSPREKEVLEHAAQGRGNREIARHMKISEQTVKNHLTSVMRKLAVNDRTHAVVIALQQGWINVSNPS